jgi:hypothetical protein
MSNKVLEFNKNSYASLLEIIEGNEGQIVQKTVKIPFSCHEDAQKYIADAEYYIEQLKKDGYVIPDVYGYDVDELNRVRQYCELIHGQDLQQLPDISAMQEVMATMASASTASDGTYHVPVDSKTANFIKDASGQVFLVDTLPPLVQKDTHRFPYDRIQHGESVITRYWVDRFVRKPEGAMVRFAALGVAGLSSRRELLHVSMGLSQPDLLDLLLQDTPEAMRNKIRHEMVPFLAGTALRRVNETLRTD